MKKDFDKWLLENEDKLLESYEFDVRELLRTENFDGISSFKDWALNRFLADLSDEQYDEDNIKIKIK